MGRYGVETGPAGATIIENNTDEHLGIYEVLNKLVEAEAERDTLCARVQELEDALRKIENDGCPCLALECNGYCAWAIARKALWGEG